RSNGDAGLLLGRLLTSGLPVVVERLQFLDRDPAVLLAGVPAVHQHLEAVAQRAAGQELAVKLLEHLEPGVGRGPGRSLGLLLLGRLGGLGAFLGLRLLFFLVLVLRFGFSLLLLGIALRMRLGLGFVLILIFSLVGVFAGHQSDPDLCSKDAAGESWLRRVASQERLRPSTQVF